MSMIRKGMVTAGGKGLAVAIQFANGIIVARTILVEGTGQSQLVVLINLLVGAICSLGIGQASIYFINNRRVPANVVTTHLMWIALAWFPIYGLIQWSVYLFIPEFVALPATVTLVACAGAALSKVANMISPVLLAEYRARDAATLEVSQAVALLACSGTLALTGNLTVQTAVMTPAFAYVVGVIVAVWMVRKHIDLRMRPTGELTRGLLGHGMKLATLNIALNLHLVAPALLLRQLSGDFHAVGLYRQATQLCTLVALVGTAASPLLYSRWAEERSTEARARQVELSTRLYCLIGLPLATLMAIGAKWVLFIPYGEAFTPAAPLLRVLAYSTAMQLVADALQNLFPALGRPLVGAGLFAATFVVNVGMCLWLIPGHGPMGAAIAMTTASAVYLAGAAWLAARLGGVRLRNCFVPRGNDVRRLLGAVGLSRPRPD